MTPAPSTAPLATTIRDVCSTQPVTLVYLFGSHARGTADAESDIDVAVLADASLSPAERRDLRLSLPIVLAEALHVAPETLDVVVLQDVPVLLQFNVVRTGQVLFQRDHSARLAYELGVEEHYEDEAPFLDREAQLTIDRLLTHHP